MAQGIKEIIKQGKFRVVYSSVKKYLYDEGELILTKEDFSLNCNEKWTKTFDIEDVRLGVWDEKLIVEDSYHGKTWFKLEIDEPRVWREVFVKFEKEKSRVIWDEILFGDDRRSIEVEKLFDIGQEAIKKLYLDTQKEREQFLRKNILFNLDIQKLYLNLSMKERKLKAFIVAHSYVAWYEWTKKLLEKLFKANKGVGPKDDKELLDYLDEYPYLRKSLDTTRWGIRANQIRNCVSHEKFYFDYKKNQLVFMLKKEKRIKIRDLHWKMRIMADFYVELFHFLKERVSGKS